MTELQARLLAGRARRAAQAQERDARALRPLPDIPAQRTEEDTPGARLSLVESAET
jgi:hypothetical protein